MLFAMTARMMPRAVLAERSESDGASSLSEARAMVRPPGARRGRWCLPAERGEGDGASSPSEARAMVYRREPQTRPGAEKGSDAGRRGAPDWDVARPRRREGAPS